MDSEQCTCITAPAVFLWDWDLPFFGLSTCPSVSLCMLLVSLNIVQEQFPFILTPFQSAFWCFLHEWKTKPPYWFSFVLSGTLHCKNNTVYLLPFLGFNVFKIQHFLSVVRKYFYLWPNSFIIWVFMSTIISSSYNLLRCIYFISAV